METIITMNNIQKVYRAGEVDVHVLRGIDLEIKASEWVALMGRSGAGKSTLMNIIGCLDKPSSGLYQLDGKDVTNLHDDEISLLRGKRIGFVFQSFHLLRGMSILENVALPMEYQHVAIHTRRQRAQEILQKVGLEHRFHHRPNQLSGGERQRVAIARALVNEPSVLLADEPTGNLDSKAQQIILDLFSELHEDMGITMIMVTHDADIGNEAQRIIEISDGKVLEVGVL